MHIDPEYPLLERYLDGVATKTESAALAEGVEADPEVLAALCEAAGIEASLRRHLATPDQRKALALRVVPRWHWRRAGKWIAMGAAAAALVVSAAIIYWPGKPGGIVRRTAGLDSGMTVRRFPGGTRGGLAPAQAPAVLENAGPMEEVEFPVHAEWRTAMCNAHPARSLGRMSWTTNRGADVFQIPVAGAAGELVSFRTESDFSSRAADSATDDYLLWYLRACGVTFPRGANARWLEDKSGFVTVNTSANIERIARVQQNPAGNGAKSIAFSLQLWRTLADTSAAVLLQRERVLSAGEFYALQESLSAPKPDGRAVIVTYPESGVRNLHQPMLLAPSESQCRFLLNGGSVTDFLGSSGPPSRWDGIVAHLQFNQWRVGDHVVISGLAGPRPGGEPLDSPPAVQEAEIEFDLTLASGEAAVLHLGHNSDETDWVLVLRASIGDHQLSPNRTKPTLILGNQPEAMRFDQTVLTVKAGRQVNLLHKNDACSLPHNFVLLKPGTAAAVGYLADRMLRDPAALAKLYIPSSPDILVTGTRLLKRGESEEILFTAPVEPGDYPYLCTAPGHWRLQQGILRVER